MRRLGLAAMIGAVLISAPAGQESRDANQIRLERLRPEEAAALRSPSGRTTLINFWATWCAPCRAEFPQLARLAERYRSRRFELVTVSINSVDEERSVRAFLETHRVRGRHLLNALMTPSELMKAFDPEWTGAVPYSIVLSPEGRELYGRIGALDVAAVKRVLDASISR